jgi:phage tail tape-measure protein
MIREKQPTSKTNDPAANPDPITKAPGAHPVGTGIGAAAGGAAGIGGAVAAGAAMGSAVGPVGTAVGAVVGAVAGGLIGKGIAEGVNPSIEHKYWRDNYASRPYATAGASYEEYGPAYQLGWESRVRHSDKDFEDVEQLMADDWNSAKGKSKLNWDQAKPAARDAWERIDADDDE